MRELRRLAPPLTAVALFACAHVAQAAGACDGFAWDVQHERALFATQAQDQKTGAAVASAPSIALDKLYRLSLVPQKHVAFAVLPGKKTHTEGVYAGLIRLHIAAGGLYRVALNARLWVDVVEGGRLVASTDFTGVRACNALHKLVLYRLTAGDMLLQVSGGASPQTELTVTRAPNPATTVDAQTSPALIPQLRQVWVADLEGRNLEASLALSATDATFINPDGTHANTPAELRSLYEAVFTRFTARIDLASRTTGQSGDLAYDSGSYTEVLQERGKPGARGIHHASGDYLTLYRRDRDGQWLILQQVWTETRP